MPRLATSRRQAAGCAPLPSAHTGSRYARHAPERTLLYALVEAHYPDFIVRIEAEGRSLPGYVREAFDAYLRCGVLEHGFLRVVCEQCRAERLVAYSCKKRGLCPSCGARRMAETMPVICEVYCCTARKPPALIAPATRPRPICPFIPVPDPGFLRPRCWQSQQASARVTALFSNPVNHLRGIET